MAAERQESRVLGDQTNTGLQESPVRQAKTPPLGLRRRYEGREQELNSVEEAHHHRITPIGDQIGPGAYTLRNRISDKVADLEERIVSFALWAERHLDASVDNSLKTVSKDVCWYVGRVCGTGTGTGRLSAQELALEGSMRHSQGQRVRLDISNAPSCQLFPGQVVAVRGVNPTGEQLLASEIVVSSLPPPTAEQLPAIAPASDAQGEQHLSMIVACGPYTSAQDLEYAPLQELLSSCSVTKPDVLLLMGPFVDADHPLISGGMADKTHLEIFEQQVAHLIEAAEGPGQVLLIPSSRDAHIPCEVPQPAFREGVAGRVSSLGNPASFACGDVVIGVCTADILRHLSSASLGQGAGKDRLADLASLIFWQNSFYPLYPTAPDVMLDHANGHVMRLPEAPDVLILPSDLNGFAKSVPVSGARAAVCINPGRLTKGTSTGTYAHLQVMKQGDRQTGSEASITERCRVSLARL